MRLALPLVAANAALLAGAVLVAAGGAPAASSGGAPGAGVLPQPQESSRVGDGPVPAPLVAATPTPRVAVPTSPPRKAAPVPPSPRPVAAPVRRTVLRTGWGTYATVGPVQLRYPGDVVEVVGLHESGHDGAQPQSPVDGGPRIGRLGSRSRGTNGQGAADIVLDPRREVRAPVTGTVLRAGSYTLYCDHVDDYVVIEPDARPGWEVKMLHFEGLRVRKGDRVQAGVTVVGSNARTLPFASQVDKHTVAPHWPHVHIEVVDTAVEDRPSGATCD